MSEDPIQETSSTDIQKETKKVVRKSSLLFVGRIFSIGLKFFIQILIVRYLSKADFGSFSYALGIVEIVVILVLVSLDKTTSRFIPIYDEENDNQSIIGLIVLTLVSILGISGAIIIIFMGTRSLMLGTLISDPLSISLLAILIFLAPLRAIDNWIQSMFAAFSRVRAIFFRRYIFWPSFQFGVILLVILAQSSVYWLAIGYLLGGLIATAMYAAMLISLLKEKEILKDFAWNKITLKPREIFGFSLPMFFTGFVLILRSHFVVILLGLFAGTLAVAEYRAVKPVIRLNTTIYDSFVFLYLPMAARLYAKNDTIGINDLFWRTAAWISIATLPVFLLTFSLADPMVILLFGAEYTNAGPIMAVMALGAYINAVMGFNKDTLRAYNKIRYLFFVDISVMVVAVVSFFIFIPPFGAFGGAVAFTTAIIVNNILYHVGLVRFTGIKIFDWSYLRVYIMITLSAVGLSVFQKLSAAPFIVGFLIATVISLIILRANIKKLQVGETFPELLKIPFARYLLQ